MNKKDKLKETPISVLDFVQYEKGNQFYDKASEAFNRGKSGINTNDEFELAAELFKKAIDHYKEVKDPDLQRDLLTNSYFNLIGSIAQNPIYGKDMLDSTIAEIKNLESISKQLETIEWKIHLSKSFYSLGMRQTDLQSKLECFYASKEHNQENLEAIYHLGSTYAAMGQHGFAKEEFQTLVSKNWPKEKLSLKMKLNSWFQLKQSQIMLDEDIFDTVDSAWKFVKHLKLESLTDLQSEVEDIYINYIIKNPHLDKTDIEESINFLGNFNAEVNKEILGYLDNEAYSLLQQGDTENAKHIGEFIEKVKNDVVGKSIEYAD